MNTPAHLMINLLALGRNEPPRYQCVILTGAILPDAPMFFFYFIEKIVRGVPEFLIWNHDYYLESWQNFIDCFNSVPFILLGLLISWQTGSKAWRLFFLSMMFHILGDFPLHHDDGHRHFFPISDWRFKSPVSYWDPQHYGHIATSVEVLAVLICACILFHTSTTILTKCVIGAVGLSYAVFFGYALWVWM